MDVFADFRLTKPNATLAPWDFDGVLEGFDEGALNHFKAPPLLYKRLLYCLCAFVAVISVLGGGFLYKLSPTLYERFEVICPARACAAMYLSGLSILLFAYVFSRPRLARRDIFCIGLAFWCMANNLFGAFRMALFAGTVGIALLFFFLKPAKNKLTICIALVAIVGAFAAKPLITNVVDKMTFTGETSVGAISSGDVRIRDNGRAEMRRVMTQYVLKDNYLFGAGCGRSQGYLYNNPVSDKIKVCHNEFLRLVCDLGIVGTIAYCAVLLCLLLRAFSISVRAPNALKCASSAVFSLIVMVTLIMMTDNVLDYFGVSGFVFALAGLISNPRYAELLCCEWL